MPRRQQLSSIIPNRFYEIDAVLKYQHVGEKTITGIIQQNNVQTKICLPNDGIELEEGKHYVFGKCFNSRNGWLYAKKPSETILQKDSVGAHEIFLNLKEVFQQRDTLTNHYISTQLKVISIEPKQTVNKNGQTLILYKLKCFSDSLLINVEIWNREFNPAEMSKIILNFSGFRIKTTSHQTITLVSTVYSKIQELTEAPQNPERFNFYDNVLYRNVSNIHETRNIDQIHKACELVHKNYSISLVGINFVEEFKYDGCSKCKKKITQNGCFQCGSQVSKVEYKYLKVILEDQSGMIECAIFDQHAQEIAKKLNGFGKAIFKIKSTAKRNHETGQIFSSHVVTDIKEFVNPQ